MRPGDGRHNIRRDTSSPPDRPAVGGDKGRGHQLRTPASRPVDGRLRGDGLRVCRSALSTARRRRVGRVPEVRATRPVGWRDPAREVGDSAPGPHHRGDAPRARPSRCVATCRYLSYSGVVGRPIVGTVRLTHAGRMQPNVEQSWFGSGAEEHHSVRPPGFVWDTTLRMGPLPFGSGT